MKRNRIKSVLFIFSVLVFPNVLLGQVPESDITSIKKIEYDEADKSPIALMVGSNKNVGFGKYPWHKNIQPYVFYIGEDSTPTDHQSKKSSIWDEEWQKNYGGYDTPDPDYRNSNYTPNAFVPNQNPFYIQLPYSDVENGVTKKEASLIIPWFKDAYEKEGKSVLKGRWVAIFSAGRTCFAQWEDAGPYSVDDWKYVFAGNTPSNPSFGLPAIGLSPAVRDYLKLDSNATCAWKFVDSSSVPDGPWKFYGVNNTFYLMRRGMSLLEFDRNNISVQQGVSVSGVSQIQKNSKETQVNTAYNSINSNSFSQATYPPSAIPTIHYSVSGIGANDTLNVHTGPGSSYPVCFQIPYDATGIIKSELPVMNGETEWVLIEYNGIKGYVVQSYLKSQ